MKKQFSWKEVCRRGRVALIIILVGGPLFLLAPLTPAGGSVIDVLIGVGAIFCGALYLGLLKKEFITICDECLLEVNSYGRCPKCGKKVEN